MPLSSTERHEHHEDAAQRHPTTGRAPAVNETEHTEHAHRARHVMPDGTVMEGAHHDHSHHAHGASSPKPLARRDESQVEYTCPMHPQVRQMGPGHCPICGMALEPVLATAETGESPELRDMTKRFWIGQP